MMDFFSKDNKDKIMDLVSKSKEQGKKLVDTASQKYQDEMAKREAEKGKIPPCPIEDIVGEPKFYLDGRGANLYVYDKCIVIDRTQGGIFNIGNRTYKVIPIKYIIAMQIKSTGLTTGFIEFSTYGHENTDMKGFDRVNDEDNVNYSSEESAKAARDILEFILQKIIE